MTDKKKLAEQAILNVTTSENGLSAETTFVADDAVALAQLLKFAGIESSQFNGPATLSVETNQGTGSMTSRITSPDLRSIMNLLEPEFQAAGDQETEIEAEPEMNPELDSTLPAPVDSDSVEDENQAIDVEFDADGNLSIAGSEDPMAPSSDADLDLEGDIEEEADYDYRTTDVEPTEYAGTADYKRSQPDTKYTPARQSDNPLKEGSAQDRSFMTSMEILGRELELSVEFDYDSGDFDTGLDSPSVANHGDHLEITSVTTEDGTDLLGLMDQADIDRLEQSARDYMNERGAEDMDHQSANEEVGPKSFAQYFEEAQLNELSRGGIRSYVDRVNSRGYDDGDNDPEELKRRGRGLSNAQAKTVWGDAKIRATEEATAQSLLDEYGKYGSKEWLNDRDRKDNQYGPAFYLNTDCGYASLEMIKNGTAEYFDDMSSGSGQVGVTVLEIDRSGKKGLNYVTSLDKTPRGTKVTCVTQTSTGQKFRPGRVVTSFTAHDLLNNYDMVVDQLAEHGITPTKKLSVKTFD